MFQKFKSSILLRSKFILYGKKASYQCADAVKLLLFRREFQSSNHKISPKIVRSTLQRKVNMSEWIQKKPPNSLHGLDIKNPSVTELRKLFFQAAVPMIAFGFTDNMVMILAGETIDSTLGVRFALSTLTAAAFGQCISDMTGVLFGNTMEAMATRLGLPLPEISLKQRQLPICRYTATAGSVLGVLFGCLMGMSTLLLTNHKETEKKKHFQQLGNVYQMFVAEGQKTIGCERACVMMVDEELARFWVLNPFDLTVNGVSYLPLNKGVASKCRLEKQLVCVADTHEGVLHSNNSEPFSEENSKNILCCPVLNPKGEVVAIVQFSDKEGGFSEGDQNLATVIARHMAICVGVLE